MYEAYFATLTILLTLETCSTNLDRIHESQNQNQRLSSFPFPTNVLFNKHLTNKQIG